MLYWFQKKSLKHIYTWSVEINGWLIAITFAKIPKDSGETPTQGQ